MKLVIAVLLATTVTAMAQVPMPRTVPWNDSEGKTIGTATISPGHVYLRDNNGELVAQVIVDAAGKRTILDPHGQPIDRQNLEKQVGRPAEVPSDRE